ncbi:hypothetical protein BJ546DRAFT_843711 [Cryomyces antarcticus]
MSHYPPPPQPDQQHYNPLQYAGPPAPQLLAPSQQAQQIPDFHQQLQQAVYPKPEHTPAEPNHADHVEQRVDQPLLPPAPSSAGQDGNQKGNRLRKACDSCSIRKVKCDESGPPCRACAALDIPCTFDRPSRRRGPPNRHAEAIKRRRLESPGVSGPSSPSSPTNAAQALAALSSHPPLSAESICDTTLLELLIQDFFTYIHPLCPFPHEPSFRESFRQREDYNNRPFLALLASMIGALVASFPRRPRLHLKALGKENLFPNHMSLVLRCQKVAAAARGAGYLERDDLNIYDAATSYFLGLTGVYTYRWRQGRLYFGECLTIIRALGLNKAKEHRYTPLGSLPAALGPHESNYDGPRDGGLDHITLEIGRRIFWTMFVSSRSMEQLGASFGELVIPPPTSSEPYPPLPVEVDDFCVYSTHIEQQPPGIVSVMTGFNFNVRVFCSYNPLSTMEMAWGIDAIVDWERQKKVLDQCLRSCKQVLDDIPQDLRVWPGVGPFSQSSRNDNWYSQQFGGYVGGRDPAAALMNPMNPSELDNSPEDRRRLQYEIQKANIYASHLSTRSYIVEKYWNLCEAHNRMKSQTNSAANSPGITAAGLDGMLPSQATSNYDLTEREMFEERESIVKDLLVVLGSINQVNMEPNADSFTMKIRSIASTLLDVPKTRKGQVALQTEQYLAAFLDILMRLEPVSPANTNPEQPDDEDAELRHWADLREYQMKFTQQGGMLGLS